MELLTDKTKQKFEEWLNSQSVYKHLREEGHEGCLPNLFNPFGKTSFKYSPFIIQSGVYLAFFDSVGMPISVNCMNWSGDGVASYWAEPSNMFADIPPYEIDKYTYPTRTEALKEAIRKYNDIFNLVK